MKKLFFILSLTGLFFLLAANSCKKHKHDVPSEESKLPPETQSGANTFGCLINGKAFLPKGSGFGGPVLSCFYIQNTPTEQGYFLGLSSSDASNKSDEVSIGIGTDSLQVSIGSYNLIEEATGNYFAYYLRVNQQGANQYYTSSNDPGVITITKFDEQNQIISGTFHFNVVTETNDTLKITEGRFDMHYTK
jgi:hypothetical protein